MSSQPINRSSTSTPKAFQKMSRKSESSSEDCFVLRSLLGVSPVTEISEWKIRSSCREVGMTDCSLSLEEAIRRVARPGAVRQDDGSSRQPRPRSYSASDLVPASRGLLTPRSERLPQTVASPSHTRVGTPESGYNTSFTSSTSSPPDTGLADLVRAMQLQGRQQGTRQRLPSISEVDPAVIEAVRNQGGQQQYSVLTQVLAISLI